MQWLVGLEATVIRKHDEAWVPWPEYHYVIADLEGHVFCICDTDRETLLAG